MERQRIISIYDEHVSRIVVHHKMGASDAVWSQSPSFSNSLRYFVQVAPGSLKMLYDFILKMLIIALLVRKQQIQLDMEKQTSSK